MPRGFAWSAEEIRILEENPALPLKVLAEKLGRTKSAVQVARSRLKNYKSVVERKKPSPAWEHDVRPSGWYEETVGTMLLECEDAYASWRHYHRYVIVEMDGDDEMGWTHLRCYRDANAP